MSQKKILVVEDDPDILEVIQLTLESKDYRVFPLLDARHTLRAVAEFQPDLIILDIMLSGMDGRAVFRDLRSRPETRDIPVMMTSARYKEEYIHGDRMEPDAFLEKPFDIDNLIARVRALTE
ncbi:response regulator [Pedobacter yulinensis]|uniref:Response regulator n=1 Tax=Pedobacter yulinensis TaxID=2126353 RepID=A0A2T3HKI5_9SPHI|nr:response regulator [Pedobacter yulinensis]PST82940.1 response regulator [Pedobacter yulinensis]